MIPKLNFSGIDNCEVSNNSPKCKHAETVEMDFTSCSTCDNGNNYNCNNDKLYSMNQKNTKNNNNNNNNNNKNENNVNKTNQTNNNKTINNTPNINDNDDDLLSNNIDVLCDGYLMVRVRRSLLRHRQKWKRYWCVLTDQEELLYFNSPVASCHSGCISLVQYPQPHQHQYPSFKKSKNHSSNNQNNNINYNNNNTNNKEIIQPSFVLDQYRLNSPSTPRTSSSARNKMPYIFAVMDVTNLNHPILLAADSDLDRQRWMTALRSLDENYDNNNNNYNNNNNNNNNNSFYKHLNHFNNLSNNNLNDNNDHLNNNYVTSSTSISDDDENSITPRTFNSTHNLFSSHNNNNNNNNFISPTSAPSFSSSPLYQSHHHTHNHNHHNRQFHSPLSLSPPSPPSSSSFSSLPSPSSSPKSPSLSRFSSFNIFTPRTRSKGIGKRLFSMATQEAEENGGGNEALINQLNQIESKLESLKIEVNRHIQESIAQENDLFGDFQRLLLDRSGVDAFHQFLMQERNAENLLFWTEVENFKRCDDDQKRHTKAQHIYHQYLMPDSPTPLNVAHEHVEPVEQALQQFWEENIPISKTIFEQAELHVLGYMKQDSFMRFTESEIGKDLMKKIEKS